MRYNWSFLHTATIQNLQILKTTGVIFKTFVSSRRFLSCINTFDHHHYHHKCSKEMTTRSIIPTLTYFLISFVHFFVVVVGFVQTEESGLTMLMMHF